MDDDLLLISELVDSDDDIEIENQLFPCNLHSDNFLNENFPTLCGILYPELREEASDLPKTSHKSASNEDCLTSFPLDAATVSCSTYSDFSSLSEDNFIHLFRVKQCLVELLTTLLVNAPVSDVMTVNVSPKEQTLAVLSFLGEESKTIEDVCERFNINADTFSHILKRVTAAVSGLHSKEISLPNERQKQHTKDYYTQNHGLQGVVGCIDSLPILLSKEDKKSGDSSKEWVILQAVVNETAKFTHVFVSKADKTDQDILLMSPLYEKLSSICSDREYLLGGATYPCQEHLLSPYPDHNVSSGDEIYFNLAVATCMQSTDTAFTLLTRRFRKLVNLKLPDLAIAPQLITACCVLHNMSSNADLENINEPPVSMTSEEHSRINTGADSLQHSNAGLKLRDDVCRQVLKDEEW